MKHKFRKDGIFNLWFYNSSDFLHILVDSLHLEPGIQNVADPTDPDAKHCSIVFIVFIFGRWIRLDDTKHGDILVSMIWKPITQNTGIPPPDHPVHPVPLPFQHRIVQLQNYPFCPNCQMIKGSYDQMIDILNITVKLPSNNQLMKRLHLFAFSIVLLSKCLNVQFC